MAGMIERQRPVIERSGMGLLPGIGLAFALCMLAIAGILTELWWVAIVVLAFLFVTAGVVVYVVMQVMNDADDDNAGS